MRLLRRGAQSSRQVGRIAAGGDPEDPRGPADGRREAIRATFVRTLATTSGTISDEQFAAIRAAGYTDQQLVEISLAFALIIFTNVFNNINDTDVDFPKL
jgi:alkylhydroperoxidase family enzyme